MKKHPVLLALLALCFTAVRAESFLAAPEYTEGQPAFVTSVNSSVSDVDLVPPRIAPNLGRYTDEAARAPARNVLPPGLEQAVEGGMDFADDIAIGDVGACQWGRLSMDHAANGDIYVAMLNPAGAPQDTCWIHRSTDNGLTWARFRGILNAAGDDTLKDAVMRVGPGTNPWVYLLCHYATSAGYLKMYRVRADGSNSQFINIVRGDSVVGLSDFDRNIETPHALFLTYSEINPSGVRLRLFASYDSGETWTNGRNVASGDFRTPKVAAGGDGYVYLTFAEADSIVGVIRYTNDLVSPTLAVSRLDRVVGDYTYDPTIAGARTTPGTSQTAWVLNRHLHSSGNYDIHSSYSTDGGVNWTTTWWPVIGSGGRDTWDMRFPFLRYAYDYTSAAIVAANATILGCGDSDSLVVAWSRNTTPDAWSDRRVVNDYKATGQHHHCSDMWIGAGGFIVAYRAFGLGALWFDYWWNSTAVAEKPAPVMPGLSLSVRPNPVADRATVAYALPKAGDADVSLFDATGRLVCVLASGHRAAGSYSLTAAANLLANGVYLLRLDLDGNRVTNRIIVSR